jgi:hypothetical protein
MGQKPLDANEDRRVAEVFVASHALHPGKGNAFEDLRGDMDRSQLDRYVKDVWERWPDLASAQDEVEAREILIDLCEQHIEELEERLKEHQENAEARAERIVTRSGIDLSKDGETRRTYRLKVNNAFFRSVGKLEKHLAKKNKDENRRGYQGEPRQCEPAIPPFGTRRRSARYNAPVADEDIDISWAKDPGFYDRVASGNLFPKDIEGTAMDPALHPGAAAMWKNFRDMTAANAAAKLADGMTPESTAVSDPLSMTTADNAAADLGDGVSSPTENSVNVTNEPKVDEKAFVAKTPETVEVAANSPLDSGFDSLGSFVVGPGPMAVAKHPLQGPTADMVMNLARDTSPQIQNSENMTNEPEHPKNVIIANHQDTVEVPANPGMTSALDTALS